MPGARTTAVVAAALLLAACLCSVTHALPTGRGLAQSLDQTLADSAAGAIGIRAQAAVLSECPAVHGAMGADEG